MNLSERDNELIAELLSDKKKFDAYVYTPLNVALSELRSRENDQKIETYLNNLCRCVYSDSIHLFLFPC